MNKCWHHQASFKRERDGPGCLPELTVTGTSKAAPLFLIVSRVPQCMDTVTSEVERQSAMLQGGWGGKQVPPASHSSTSKADNH